MNNNKEFKDSLRLAKELNSKELVMNYTTIDDYFRSPLIPDNQKVLIALLVLKKRFKALTVSNKFIANFLNAKGIYSPVYETVEGYDDNGELVTIKTTNIIRKEVVYKKIVVKDGTEVEEPLYTRTAVSDAIKKWEHEGILKCSYKYSFNNDDSKPYKFDTNRTITFNFDALRPLLACSSFEALIYKNLPDRSRKRKLIRSKPFSILDELKELLDEMSEELKAKYQTAKGIFLNWCWDVSRKYYDISLKHKPTAAETRNERTERLENIALKRVLEPDRYNNRTSNENETIKAVFKKMVGTY